MAFVFCIITFIKLKKQYKIKIATTTKTIINKGSITSPPNKFIVLLYQTDETELDRISGTNI